MGYAGNMNPSYIIPTVVGSDEKAGAEPSRGKMDDLDFYVGDEAVARSRHLQLNYPIRHGLIENWTNMERLWQRCIYDYLRAEPEDHYVLLTEPPLNTPENREYTAEVMFETYNVPGLYIAVQAVLALAASWTSKKAGDDRSLTGTVIDSGDGVTHVIPVAEGYVIGSCIKHIPLAGRDMTEFIQKQLRERGEPIPPEDALTVAKRIKEEYCYVAQDMVKEFQKYDTNPDKFKKYTGVHGKTKAPWSCDIGYEQFLAPEMFFNPEIYSEQFATPLPQVVDEVVLASPIDCRRRLYGNIVLSGGSTLYKNFHLRLQGEIQDRVDTRLRENMDRIARKTGVSGVPTSLPVQVIKHKYQRYAVWLGGSIIAGSPGFNTICHSRERYLEEGPRIARHNAVFSV